ncbi:hypothetical protein FHX49_001064 [Microbacterium endophyticum]|nr:hypothetical protein [Microbacterium endophyticum]MBB2975498.1 hypothetical protein [Microbacterium endophyticum]NIK35483.1 hypothetical protein [Microbacterium endophyticum]
MRLDLGFLEVPVTCGAMGAELKDPNRGTHWMIYVGVAMLATGVVVLCIAAFLQYAAAMR